MTATAEANQYTVKLNPDVPCQIENPVIVTYDKEYTLSELAKRGYAHTGWTDGKNNYPNKDVWKTANDVSVTPVWEIINYALKYNLVEGTLDKENPA